MNIVLPGLIASALYLASAALQLRALSADAADNRNAVIGLGAVGIVLHAVTVFQVIFTDLGVNLALVPMVSLMSLAVAATLIASSLRRQVENLLIGVLPLSGIAVVVSIFTHDASTPRADLSNGFVLHIILSVIAYSLLTIAALQACLLSFGDYELRHRRLSVMKRLPPLQTMEGLLFELLWAGLTFLSASILTGFVYLTSGDSIARGLVHHTVITLGAWTVFAVLLWGRYQLGWRGQIASRWTLAGFALLVLGYFGSKFVLEVLLGRA